MSQIKNLIEQHVPSSYRRQAQPVVDNVVRAVEQAAARAAETIRAAGRDAGVNPAQVEEVLISAGLVERPVPPPPAAQTSTTEGRDGALERLVAFAERHGFRG